MKQNSVKYLLLIAFIVFGYACGNKSTHKTNKYSDKQIDTTLVKVNKYLVKADQERIKNYIRRNNLDMQQLPTGMWYKIERLGKDTTTPKEGNTVYIEYTLKLLDGKKCYDSDSLGVKKFKVDYSYVERGLNDAVKLMHVGDKGTFIIPPYLAWGLPGDGKCIPSRAIIIYDVKLLKIE